MRNKVLVLMTLIAALGLTTESWSASGPPPPFNPPAGAFQMRYASNLSVGDSVINLSNSGSANGGDICANVYVFDPSEEMIACCSCRITPDGLNSLSARTDLISNTLTPGVPTSIVVKLLASYPVRNTCNAATGPNQTNLNSALVAWGTTLHALPTTPITYGVTEEEFTSPILGASEFTTLTQQCNFIQTNGSGFGICRSCRIGGL